MEGTPRPGGEVRRLGVIGTLVWDTIHDRDGAGEPVHEWGGIAYTLGALEAALPPEWEIVPILKIGSDLSERALTFLRDLPRVRSLERVRVVPESNNRVELRYVDSERRAERLTGGVPPWTPLELEGAVSGLDAVFVNFISGFEMDLGTATRLRWVFPGPLYADLHSLFLGLSVLGDRTPRELDQWPDWLRCFDAVQMNEVEFGLLGGGRRDSWMLAAEAVGHDLRLITVTLGPRGAAFVREPDFIPNPLHWSERAKVASGRPAVSGRVPLGDGHADGDPTGCGDVWGATFFARLLGGDEIERAMEEANRLAERNVRLRGAEGLHLHLSGRLVTAKRNG